ncbi:MAG: BlaI/MecI/CopY family transcriptional regulator [Planctomycetaceae bacterium]
MVRKPKDVTDAELNVLETLWEHGPSTVRQLTDRLYPDGTSSHYATVLKLLERLEGKQCVRRDSQGPAHVFTAAVARGDLIERRLQAVAESLCGGSRTPLLMHLVDPRRLTDEERRALRQLIDELD